MSPSIINVPQCTWPCAGTDVDSEASRTRYAPLVTTCSPGLTPRDLHQFALTCAERDRPPLERLAFDLHEHDRPARIVDNRRRRNDRRRRRLVHAANAGTRTGRPRARATRLSAANVIGTVRDCGSSTRPIDTSFPGRQHRRWRSGTSICAASRRAAHARAAIPAHGPPRERRPDRRDETAACPTRHSCPPRHRAARSTPLIGARITNEPAAAAGAGRARRIELRQLRLGRAQRGGGLGFGRARFIQPLLRRRTGRHQSLGSLAITRREFERRRGLRPTAFELRQIRGSARWRLNPRQLLPARHRSARRVRHHRDESAIERREHVGLAARRRHQLAGHTQRRADRLFLNDGRCEIQRPLLFLQK